MIGLNYSSIDLYKNNEIYKLSSIITEDNFLYGITRKSDNKLVSVKEISGLKKEYYFDTQLIKEIFEQNKLLNNQIVEISIAFMTSEFTLVPKEFKIGDPNKLLSAVSIKQYYDNFDIVKTNIDVIDAHNYFPFPIELEKFVKTHYNKVEIHHANDVILNYIKTLNGEKNVILANLHEYHLQTIVIKNGEFIQSNIYKIKTKDDILYHILANLNNNAIPLNLTKVLLSGRVEKESAIYKLLYEHIKNIEFIKDIPRTHFSNIFLGKPKHLFFDIYSLARCES